MFFKKKSGESRRTADISERVGEHAQQSGALEFITRILGPINERGLKKIGLAALITSLEILTACGAQPENYDRNAYAQVLDKKQDDARAREMLEDLLREGGEREDRLWDEIEQLRKDLEEAREQRDERSERYEKNEPINEDRQVETTRLLDPEQALLALIETDSKDISQIRSQIFTSLIQSGFFRNNSYFSHAGYEKQLVIIDKIFIELKSFVESEEHEYTHLSLSGTIYQIALNICNYYINQESYTGNPWGQEQRLLTIAEIAPELPSLEGMDPYITNYQIGVNVVDAVTAMGNGNEEYTIDNYLNAIKSVLSPYYTIERGYDDVTLDALAERILVVYIATKM